MPLFFRSVLAMQDRILTIRVLASLGLEPYGVTNGWCIYYFQPRRGHTLLQEYGDRDGRNSVITLTAVVVLLKIGF